ncbi:DUF2922 domain-containing protein [Lacticaseibacillus nasuensis]|uniref:DUF2922 domain-containing protein n=1 Tax=Lacticaseibacillus nasuensis JCM 17158 TaxID=1291734 RepID=A0A0R1K0B4_9LACO|nr:DUF2922 domain-containing protein [Lacticaseibacillus nasuensis]KRK74097.1 hypothetical protein FD02_GL001421 [Lacticaseibacillus nasuensis JCM 17158]MCX2455079.1 DUF2922 domain-containing protein [Lacticaseibacillus nasuensis]
MFNAQMTFVASDGTRKTVTIPNVDSAVDAARLRAAMNGIINADLIGRNGVRYYRSIYTAKLIQTDTQVLVDDSKNPVVAA